MITLIVAAIGGTFAVIQGFDISLNPSAAESPVAGAFLTGNVKVTQFDEDGNVKAYRQSDNHIVAKGMKIIMGQVFHNVNETYANPTHAVRYMGIGTGGENVYASALRWNDTNLNTPLACARQQVALDNSSNVIPHKAPSTCAPATSCFARFNVTLEATFSGAACGGAPTIDEAGVFTEPATSGTDLMFARNTFGSVVLNPLDSLQLNWEFTFTDS